MPAELDSVLDRDARRAAAGRCPISDTFDPFGAVFQADPAGSLRESRAEQPVFFSSRLGFYVITRHEDIRSVLKDNESFSTQMTNSPITPLCEAAQAVLRENGFSPVKTLGSDEGPLHMKRRKLLDEPFSVAHLAQWEPRVREVVGGCIDGFVARGRADAVAELFWKAPPVIALEFMGVPEGEVETAKRFADGVMTFKFGMPTEADQVATCELMCENQAYARGLLERIKLDPSGPGFLQLLIRAWQEDPELLDDSFLLGLATTTLAAAHETTSHAQANALLLLLRQRARWEGLCADPARIPGAVEECLRMVPSLTALQRLCVKDVTIGEVEIPTGAKVLLSIASGNCDDAMFADADVFHADRREARRHLSFGFGAHVCLGAPLARLQMKVALEELTRRLPHLELVEEQEIVYEPTASPHGPQHLLIRWDPAQNPVG